MLRKKDYVVVIRSKDKSLKLTSDQVKKRVVKEANNEVNIRVNAVRKTRSAGIGVKTASEAIDLRVLKECKKFNDLGLKLESQRRLVLSR